MKSTRDVRYGSVFLLALLATAFAFAEYADAVRHAVSGVSSYASSGPTPATIGVSCLSWSADGRKLLSLRYGDIGPYGPLVLHDIDHESELLPIDAGEEPANDAALAPDGRHVLVGTIPGKLLWISVDSDQREILLDLQPPQTISAVAISGDGRHIAAVDGDGNVYLFDLECGTRSRFSVGVDAAASSLRFSSDGSRLVAAGCSGIVGIWDVLSGTLLHRFSGMQSPMIAASFLASNDRILSAGCHDSLRIWDVQTGVAISQVDGGQSLFHCMSVAGDGRIAARGGCGPHVAIWDVETGLERFNIETTMSFVGCVEFSPDGRHLAVSGLDSAIHIFETGTGARYRRIEIESGEILPP